MKITQGTVVTISYKLTLDSGEVADSTEEREPLTYLHGSGQIIRGLESRLEGMQAGESSQISVTAADGYGESRPEMVFPVPRAEVAMADLLKPGMQFAIGNAQTGRMRATVQKMDEDTIWLDANHPMAGQNLHFAVRIEDVRQATPIEMEGMGAEMAGGEPSLS